MNSLNEGCYKLAMKKPATTPSGSSMSDCWVKVKLEWESRCVDLYPVDQCGVPLPRPGSHHLSLSALTGLREESHAELVEAHLD